METPKPRLSTSITAARKRLSCSDNPDIQLLLDIIGKLEYRLKLASTRARDMEARLRDIEAISS